MHDNIAQPAAATEGTRALLIPADLFEPIEEIFLPADFMESAERISQLVDGGIERVSHPTLDDVVCWLDGNGWNQGKIPNIRATRVFYPHGNGLAGPVVVTGENWMEEIDVAPLRSDFTAETILAAASS